MDDLESINPYFRENYYDKSDWDEDECGKEIPLAMHRKFEELEIIFDVLCGGVNEKEAEVKSDLERETKKIRSNDFIYGEITFRSFSYLLNFIDIKYELRKGIFYDLGAGSGRAVLAASLINSKFTKCIGIELLEELFLFSLRIIDNINNANNSEIISKLQCNSDNIELKQGDILESDLDFENTSLIFMNCKTFSKDLMSKIAEKISKMPKGVFLITSSQIFTDFDDNWVLLDKMRKVMSWGCANMYIHKKQ